jgi:hypothetical protein
LPRKLQSQTHETFVIGGADRERIRRQAWSSEEMLAGQNMPLGDQRLFY